MSPDQQPRRRYDVSSRRRQAAENRERVLVAARRLFIDHGYAGTSIAEIAAQAGVSGRTVFVLFETKAGLLKEIIDTAIVGDTERIPLAQRPEALAVQHAATADEAIARLADMFAEISPRVYDVYMILHGAALVDPDIAQLERDLQAQRLIGAGLLARTLADRFGITDSDRLEDLRDTLWTIGSPLVFGMLVHDRRRTVPQYRDWITRALVGFVSAPQQPAGSRVGGCPTENEHAAGRA